MPLNIAMCSHFFAVVVTRETRCQNVRPGPGMFLLVSCTSTQKRFLLSTKWSRYCIFVCGPHCKISISCEVSISITGLILGFFPIFEVFLPLLSWYYSVRCRVEISVRRKWRWNDDDRLQHRFRHCPRGRCARINIVLILCLLLTFGAR